MSGSAADAIGAVLKNPAVGNGTSGILVVLVGILTLNPGLLPYAQAEHEHDIKAVQEVVTKTVEIANTRTFIHVTDEEITNYMQQIRFKLCLDEECKYEKSQLDKARVKKDTLERELDRQHKAR